MKKTLLIAILFSCLLTACEYDNYNEPDVVFMGNIVYNGENVIYDGNPSKPLFRVIQSGYGKVDGGTAVQTRSDGSFRHLLFPGRYYFTPYNNIYPFVFPDFPYLGESEGYPQTRLDLYNNFSMDVEAIPYYIIKDFNVVWDEDKQEVYMSCNVAPNDDERLGGRIPAIKAVRGYMSTTTIVNSSTSCARKVEGNWPAFSGASSMTIEIGDYYKSYVNNFRSYGYCRMAFELDGIKDYYLFTPIVKVEGLPVQEWKK